jgi:exodeoxyribonuclease VII large subunit
MDAMPDPLPTVHRLRAVTRRIGDLLLEASARRFWVRAQLVVGSRERRAGHFYCELVDVDDRGRQVAKIDAVIWRDAHQRIRSKLAEHGLGDALTDNTEICAHCSLSYHELYGLKLEVHDVDPTFGEAHIERNRREILERLRKDGLLKVNRGLLVPDPPLRIGLVTARASAAYEDFRRTLEASPYAFCVLLASAAMQGERSEREVVTALRSLVGRRVDVVCIVRGGGSQLDLAWFDNERIARAVATSPVPVLVGIGHEIDAGVLDVVAHSSFKTPTAVAEHLVSRVRELDDRLAVALERLQSSTERRIGLAGREVERSRNGLVRGSRKHLDLFAARHTNRALRVRAGFYGLFATRSNRLERSIVALRERAAREVRRSEVQLDAVGNRLGEFASRLLVGRIDRVRRNWTGLVRGIGKQVSDASHQLDARIAKVSASVERTTATPLRRLDRRADRVATLAMRLLDGRAWTLGRYSERISDGGRRTLSAKVEVFGRQLCSLGRGGIERRLVEAESRLRDREMLLRASGPEQLLERGYALVRDESGRPVRSVRDCDIGRTIGITVSDGKIKATVTSNRGDGNE